MKNAAKMIGNCNPYLQFVALGVMAANGIITLVSRKKRNKQMDEKHEAYMKAQKEMYDFYHNYSEEM